MLTPLVCGCRLAQSFVGAPLRLPPVIQNSLWDIRKRLVEEIMFYNA
jgi:hypothetical protein